MTGDEDLEQREKRGDVIIQIRKKADGYRVHGWGKHDTSVLFKNDALRLRMGKYLLPFSKSTFSDTWKGEQNIKFQNILYPARTLVFLNKMRAEYIDTQLGTTTAPFSMDGGELMFAVDPKRSDRGRKEYINDEVCALSESGWEMLGISQDVDKQNFCDFLNALYKKNSKK